MTEAKFLTDVKSVLRSIEFKGPEAVNMLAPGLDANNLAAGVIAYPKSTQDVSQLLAFCNAHDIAIVPQGGRTGLAGGAVSEAGQLILSTQALNKIISIDAASRLAIVEAGVTLAALQAAAAEQGLSPGIDLGARDSATIGGMISTNAGGIEAFRHGVMRQRVLGLEAVLADGTVMSDLARVTKCNEGYDAKQLFIGAEGTLGVVTRAVIKLVPLPKAKATALVAVPALDTAVGLFNTLSSGEALLAFELMNPRYFKLAGAKDARLLPLADAGYVFIIEMQGATPEAANQILEDSLSTALEDGQVADAVIAKSAAEARAFWTLREDSWVVDRTYPHGLWFDVTVPLNKLGHYLQAIDDALNAAHPHVQAFVIGHLGDGNLHLTIASHQDLAPAKEAISAIVYQSLKPMGGSFSAEHGIGLEKREALARYGDPGKRALMVALKAALDHKCIMNPGKII
jgi:FAD/FMN-containing dehydrogenase